MTANDTSRFSRLQRIVEAAAELPADAQGPYIEREAGSDAELAAEARDLLRHYGQWREGFEEQVQRAVAREASAMREPDPTHIGPYRIVRRLPKGGMGVVYLAEREGDVRQLVAIKVIKRGLDTEAVVARFRREQQAMAMMDHDGIARVFDCGTTPQGKPYFVMEYVDGVPLTTFCQRERLDLRQRLVLMQRVCEAVHHAHTKGVVHRDLKPTNVLARGTADDPHVKVIDFGLAKAMDAAGGDDSTHTLPGAVVGTLEYMAPEQAASRDRNVDTLADIYSLGVMLYELLVGTLPFGHQQLRKAAAAEVERILREVDPPRPSVRLTSSHADARRITEAQRTSTSALHRALRSDLDWAVLKAMHKDRKHRYQSALAMRDDLQNFLDHKPLVAGPPSRLYQLQKLFRRHRGMLLAVAAVLVTALAGTVVATDFAIGWRDSLTRYGLLEARVQHDRTLQQEQQLYPAWPDQLAPIEEWTEARSDPLLARRDEIEAAIADLASHALPRSPEDARRDLETHPRHAEWVRRGEWLRSLRRAQAIRDAGRTVVPPELDAETAARSASDLQLIALSRTSRSRRDVPGEEAYGLACARLAVQKAEGTAGEAEARIALAIALAANGQDAAALAEAALAVERAPEDQREARSREREVVAETVREAAATLAEADADYAELTEEVSRQRTWVFPDDLISEAFLHRELMELRDNLDELEHVVLDRVQERRRWATQIAELTRDHPSANWTWAEVNAALADPDGLTTSSLYRAQRIELLEDHVLGLVPIGPNPNTGLWEFYHLRSAWDGESDPRTIALPERGADGYLELDADSGIVFVLIPGGTFAMGAQNEDRDRPNFEADIQGDESFVTEVRLDPFFLASHEVTKRQWQRLAATCDIDPDPSFIRVDSVADSQELTTWAHPVEHVDWWMCDTLLRRHGLCLPTEAQWEYACRAGTDTPFAVPVERLVRHANLADQFLAEFTKMGEFEEWNDGHGVPAPIDDRGFTANGFGLFHMHGNVAEWCRDTYARYTAPPRPGDGLRSGNGKLRMSRGGTFWTSREYVRSARRNALNPSARVQEYGVRAARALVPER